MSSPLRPWALAVAVGVVMSAAGSARAQPTATAPDQTFFAAPTRVRLVAGPWTRLTRLGDGDVALMAGGGGGFLVLDHLLLMGYTCSLSGRTTPGDPARTVEVTNSGGQVAWVVAPAARLHVNVGALIGVTSAKVSAMASPNDHTTLSFVTLSPYAEAEVSLYPGLKLFAGLGYRVPLGADASAGVDRAYLRGPELEFGFRMGG